MKRLTKFAVLKRVTPSRNATRFDSKRYFSALTAVLAMVATPALAEAPIEDSTFIPQNNSSPATVRQESIRQNNIRQLMLLNECGGCDLQGVSLTEAHLIGVDLRNANLQGANLTGSNLEGADLDGANLSGANLTDAFMTHTNLANTRLDNVNFSGAHLYYVDVAGASMNNLNLTGAELLYTPIYVGGEEQLREENLLLEPIIPFKDTIPPEFNPTPVLPVLEPGSY